MKRLTGIAVALLVLALFSTGAAAQGCGCGGSKATDDVILTVEVEQECSPTKGKCGGDCKGDGSCATCQKKAKAGKKCSGKCKDGGKCDGACKGKCGGDCKGDGSCATCQKKAKAGKKCSGKCKDGKCGCAGTTFVTEFETDLGAVKLRESDSVTVVGNVSLKDAVRELQKKSKQLRKLLRALEASGLKDEAKMMAGQLKELNGHIARLKKLAEDTPATAVRGRVVSKKGKTIPAVKIVPGPTTVAEYVEVKELKTKARKGQPLVIRTAGDIRLKGTIGVADTPPAKGWLGITMTPTDAGVRVASTVAGSPAERAGIREGDVIVLVDNEKIQGVDNLARIVGGTPPGKVVKLKAIRGDGGVWFAVRLGSRPTDLALSTTPAPPAVVEDPVIRDVRRRTLVATKKAKLPAAIRRAVVKKDFAAEPKAVALPKSGGRGLSFVGRAAPTAAGQPQVKKQEQLVAGVSKRLRMSRVTAQKALADGQYARAAEMCQVAQKMAAMLEVETKKLADMKRRAAAAAAQGRFALAGLRPGTYSVATTAPTAQVQNLERRLMALEKRLERIEKLLQRLVRE